MKSKKKNYLAYLNDNYFYEIGYVKKESNIKYIKMKKSICKLVCAITFNKVCLGWCEMKCCK